MSVLRNSFLTLLAISALPVLLAQSGVPVAGTGGGDLNATTTTQTVTFNVSGLSSTSPVEITVAIAIWHDYLGDVDLTLTAPNTNSHLIFQKLGGGTYGSSAHFGNVAGTTHGVYTFHDAATVNPFTEAGSAIGGVEWIPSGDLRTVDAAGNPTVMNTTINSTGVQANGTWTLSFTDTYPSGDFGNVNAAACMLTITEPTAPLIRVERATMPITDDGTDSLGLVSTAGQSFTYTIFNDGNADLNLTGTPLVVATPGTETPGVSITTPPAALVAPAGMTTFDVLVTPANTNAFTFTLSVDNDDTTQHPFNFTVDGTGFDPNLQAVANPATGSAFTGPTDGPFNLAVDPGTVLANATLELTDPEGDDIAILSVTETSATAVVGITPPAVAGAATSPIALTFTGTADGSNAPGTYSWDIVFEDDTNGTDVTITVNIVINDVAPAHTIANASGGDGSAATPYTGQFTQGDTGANSIDLCNVTDGNTSQVLSLVGSTAGGSNPAGGAGLVFNVAAGVLTVMPGGTLVAADRGTHTFDVEITDGTNNVIIAVEIEVVGVAPSITSTPVTSVTPGNVYSYTVVATGTPAPTVSVTSALPGWLTFNAGTGILSGTPTKSDEKTTVTVSITASNGVTPDAVQTFDIQVNAAPSSDSDDDGGSCSGGNGSLPLLAILALAALGGAAVVRRRKA